jgi:hypothetical protein
MAAPTFLFGIGAAKAGTTWLAQALRAHPQAAMPPFKETHYFDSLEHDSALWSMDQLIGVRQGVRVDLAQAKTRKIRDRLTFRVKEMDRWMGLVGAKVENDKRYEALMHRRANDETRVCADITPAYALLSEKTYKRMAALNGGKTRFVMILRDPVDRLWSNLSMTAQRRAKRGRPLDDVQNELLRGITDGSNSAEMARSDYASTLARLAKAVPKSKLKVLFFEQLFEKDTLEDLSGFLGFDDVLTGPSEPANAGAGQAMDANTHTLLADAMQPQYDFVMSRFDAVPPRWQDNMKGPVQ